MSLFMKRRTSPPAIPAAELFKAAQLKGRASEMSLVSVRAARRLGQCGRFRQDRPIVNQQIFDRQRPLRGVDRFDAGAEEPGFVAKGNDDADQDVGSNGPTELERARVEPRCDVPRLVPACQCVDHVIGMRSILARIERRVAEHLGDVHRALRALTGPEGKVVFELHGIKRSQCGHSPCDARPHCHWSSRVRRVQQEFGRIARLEAW